MSLAIIHSRALHGMQCPAVTVEVHLANGLPAFSIVGLAEQAVKESKDRVRGALQTCGFDFPNRRITVNLAPADLPKEGSRFDLPIALGILAAADQIPDNNLDTMEFIGELALSGALRPVRGVLPAALAVASSGRLLPVPQANREEAALVEDNPVLAAEHLLSVCQHLHGSAPLAPVEHGPAPAAPDPWPQDFAEVCGQQQAKRALEIAAAGGHSLLMIGPPGTGKSMLASRVANILPPMTQQEALESAAIQSISGHGFDTANWKTRPYRAPHHSASSAALVGGGSQPKPGEISLAHQGVLFLDELPEFDRKALEVLREPLETGQISISRVSGKADFPARFQLIAAMNPCPCGYLGDPQHNCR